MDPRAPTVRITEAETMAGEVAGPAAELPPSLEARFIGRFAVLRKLGEGGMGTVYAAYDERLERRVALKLLHGGDHARLLREAQALARLSHPHVVQIYEVGEVEGRVFVAMEHVAGPTLATWLADAERSADEILDVFVQAGRGLAAAHAGGLVHRDFKPGNVIVGDDGRVRVLDFGLARAGDTIQGTGRLEHVHEFMSETSLLTSPLTLTGATLGTPAYMSPEQHTGAAVDARSDQFSLCAALFEALHGVRPFAGETLPALASNVVSGRLTPVPPRSDVAPAIAAAIRRGLASEPEARWPTMAALLAVLASGRGQAAALEEGRARRLVGSFVFAAGVALLVGVQLVLERPEDATAGQMTVGAAGFLVLGLGGLPVAHRRFRQPRHRVMMHFAVVMLGASLAIRMVMWQANQPWTMILVAESVIYAATLAAGAACMQAPGVLLAAAIHLAGPALVLVLGVAAYWLPVLWLASVPVAVVGLRRAGEPT